MDISATNQNRLWGMSFAALGVVFGDIGTSPLYAFRQAIHGLPVNTEVIYGVLSLIFWALVLIICIKYLIIVFRADNDGEGGILALTSLVKQKVKKSGTLLLIITIFGIGLILGDGMLTPSISVLSAIEGINEAFPAFKEIIIPLTIIILISLFILQRYGTGKIGVIFAPIILIWFITIGIIGLVQILKNPHVLAAINPYYAFYFFISQKHLAILTLGGVFLVMTGGEALFADLGHFGKNPIRIAWFSIVFPGLFLSYFGQGAYVLARPESVNSPFYSMAPNWFLPIMLFLAAAATIIASQAIISAAFSILKQASLLNLVPRLDIKHTSKSEKGQVYLPIINIMLVVGTVALVLGFHSSSNLASAFGIAVNLDMIITTILVAVIAYLSWKWNIFKISIFILFLIIDILFLAGNLPKFFSGGWIPITIACITIIILYTWHRGFEQLREFSHRDSLLDRFIIDEINQHKITRQSGTLLYITDPYDERGDSLLYHLRINRILAETMIFLNVMVGNKPYVPLENKFEIITKAENLYILNVHYGFAESINVPNAIEAMVNTRKVPFKINLKRLIYFVEIITIEVTDKRINNLWIWQKHLFTFMLRNAVHKIKFYQLPYNKTTSIGTYYQI